MLSGHLFFLWISKLKVFAKKPFFCSNLLGFLLKFIFAQIYQTSVVNNFRIVILFIFFFEKNVRLLSISAFIYCVKLLFAGSLALFFSNSSFLLVI